MMKLRPWQVSCPTCITEHGTEFSPSRLLTQLLPPPPGAHLAKVVKVVLVPDPPVTGLSTVRLVGDVPGVFALANKELPFEELDTHIPRDRKKRAVTTGIPELPSPTSPTPAHPGGGRGAWSSQGNPDRNLPCRLLFFWVPWSRDPREGGKGIGAATAKGQKEGKGRKMSIFYKGLG